MKVLGKTWDKLRAWWEKPGLIVFLGTIAFALICFFLLGEQRGTHLCGSDDPCLIGELRVTSKLPAGTAAHLSIYAPTDGNRLSIAADMPKYHENSEEFVPGLLASLSTRLVPDFRPSGPQFRQGTWRSHIPGILGSALFVPKNQRSLRANAILRHTGDNRFLVFLVRESQLVKAKVTPQTELQWFSWQAETGARLQGRISAAKMFQVPTVSTLDVTELSAAESQLAGVLAGFSLTVALVLLERRGENVTSSPSKKDPFLYQASIAVFVASCFFGTIASALYALVTGAKDGGEAARLLIHSSASQMFGLCAITLFAGIYLALAGSFQGIEYRMAYLLLLAISFVVTSFVARQSFSALMLSSRPIEWQSLYAVEVAAHLPLYWMLLWGLGRLVWSRSRKSGPRGERATYLTKRFEGFFQGLGAWVLVVTATAICLLASSTRSSADARTTTVLALYFGLVQGLWLRVKNKPLTPYTSVAQRAARDVAAGIVATVLLALAVTASGLYLWFKNSPGARGAEGTLVYLTTWIGFMCAGWSGILSVVPAPSTIARMQRSLSDLDITDASGGVKTISWTSSDHDEWDYYVVQFFVQGPGAEAERDISPELQSQEEISEFLLKSRKWKSECLVFCGPVDKSLSEWKEHLKDHYSADKSDLVSLAIQLVPEDQIFALPECGKQMWDSSYRITINVAQQTSHVRLLRYSRLQSTLSYGAPVKS